MKQLTIFGMAFIAMAAVPSADSAPLGLKKSAFVNRTVSLPVVVKGRLLITAPRRSAEMFVTGIDASDYQYRPSLAYPPSELIITP